MPKPSSSINQIAARHQASLATFLNKARELFGDHFDYSHIEYINQKTPVTISCRLHGDFQQTPDKHLQSKYGCPKCGVTARASQRLKEGKRRFEEAFIETYGARLELLSEYVSVKDRIQVRCRIHNLNYETTPDRLNIQTYSCPQCAAERKDTGRLGQAEFIARCKERFGDLFDLSKVIYQGMAAPVIVGCMEHGEFKTKPVDFLHSTHGCRKCAKAYTGHAANRIQLLEAGLSKSRPTTIALMSIEVFGIEAFKLGITIRTLEERYGDALRAVMFETRLDELNALKLEQRLHAKYWRERDVRIFLAGLRNGKRWAGDGEIYKAECIPILLQELQEGVAAIEAGDPTYWTTQSELQAPLLKIRTAKRKEAGVFNAGKAVIRLDTLEVFPSATAAAKATGTTQSAVSAVCRGEAGQAKGFRFALLSDYEAGTVPIFSNERAGANHSRARQVRCIDTGDVYETMTEAQLATGVHQSKISMVCSGKRVRAGGLRWEYC